MALLLPPVARACRPPLCRALCEHSLGRVARAGGTGEVGQLRRAREGPGLPTECAVLEVSTFRKSHCGRGRVPVLAQLHARGDPLHPGDPAVS